MRRKLKCPRCGTQIAWQVDDNGDINDYTACDPDGSGEYEMDENESYCETCHTIHCSNCDTALEREYNDYRYYADLLDFKCDKCLSKEGIFLDFGGHLIFPSVKLFIKRKRIK